MKKFSWHGLFIAALVALINVNGSAVAQMMVDKQEATTNGILSSGASGDIGRMDTSLGTPVIRSDDGQIREATVVRTISENDKQDNSPAPPRPLPPNDFQQFVQTSTGKLLPLYGFELFSTTRFNIAANTPVASDYRLGPGDELRIKGWGSIELDVRASIDRNGLIHIPRVGSIQLAGVRSSDAEASIRSAIARYYKDFQISVTQGQIRGITIYVVGQARQPGSHTVSGASTLISALFEVGGPNSLGSMRKIHVKRGERTITEIDLYEFIAHGNKSGDIRLQDGDTVVIPPASGYIALTGAVATPAVYEIKGAGEILSSILTYAAGLPVLADPKQAYLERVDPSLKPSRSVESFPLDTANLRKVLRNGDVLSVLPLTGEFANAVTLRGNVEQPVRSPWRDGMKIKDLIPNKSVLMSRASVQRQNNVLRSDETNDSLTRRIGNLIDEVNLDYAVIERVNSQQISMQLIPFNLGKALDDPGSPDNLPLQPGDIVTVFSVNDVRVPQSKRKIFVQVEGEVAKPGIYQMSAGDGLLELIRNAGGLTADAYLFGAEFYREQVRVAQQNGLTKLLDQMELQAQGRLNAAVGSATSTDNNTQLRIQAEIQSQQRVFQRLRNLKPTGRVMLNISPEVKKQRVPGLKLENQDRLIIPPKPDFVYVLGAVNSEAAFVWQPNKSVKTYLDLAGLTIGADADEAFILRADGSVVGSKSMGFFGSIGSVNVLPGDTLVLPEKVVIESPWSVFTRNAKDITQIIYQFSLGAAAIKTLRD